jgi:hypothetical protein
MSYKIVAIKKLKIITSIPSLLLFGAKFCQNTENFLRLRPLPRLFLEIFVKTCFKNARFLDWV